MTGILKAPLGELNLSLTLRSGQCFRWKKRLLKNEAGLESWVGIIGHQIISLSQDIEKGIIHYSFEGKQENSIKKRKIDEESLLRDYFQLDINLTSLYESWSLKDPNFKEVSSRFPGVRVLRQDPVENLISFICSSCNNIPRITSMIDKICISFGQLLTTDEEFGDIYSFPSLESLASEEASITLSKLGLGFRAKYITSSARMILKNDISSLKQLSLESTSFLEARTELMKLPGVGRKVSDCVCLFSLNKKEAVPVDTHVYQIACKYYMKYLNPKKKSLSEKDYEVVANFFRDIHGSYAGWAHSVLFTAHINLRD
jgi:N-glycosylase/DNA lyase